MFLTYINDLPECTNSDARLFADDCLVYRQFRNQSDAAKLQEDLTALDKMGTKVADEFPSGKVHGYSDLEQKTATANVLYPARTLAGSCREWKILV